MATSGWMSGEEALAQIELYLLIITSLLGVGGMLAISEFTTAFNGSTTFFAFAFSAIVGLFALDSVLDVAKDVLSRFNERGED